jgi:sterol desaturase/sphingolipid hydroxylase (fatty acid hydroxylase superfamily)
MGAWLDQYYVYWFWLGTPFFVCLFLVLEKNQSVSDPQSEKGLRLLTNLGLFIFTMVTFFVIQSFSPLELAREIYNARGLFNFVNAPLIIEIVISFLVLDLAMYIQHRLLHKFPLLWRVHKVHHSDVDFDCTTGFRFHPLEVLFTVTCQLVTVIIFGLSPLAILLFNFIHLPYAYFSHLNVRLNERLESFLSFFIITPHLHRIHHSMDLKDSNANFSIFLTCWDTIFGTLRRTPQAGELIQCGIAELGNPKDTYLDTVLLLPFKRKK